MSSHAALLQVKDLNRFFGGLHAVANVTFETSRGQIQAVIGPNGAGKTTLFNLISGTLKPNSGQVFFDGNLITGLKIHRIARSGIARTFQNIRLFPGMTVMENVMLGRHTQSKAGLLGAMLKLPSTKREERAIRDRARELVELFELDDVAEEDAQALPFGRQRMVELARALASDPSLLLLDEPASGLNIRETEELAEEIRRIRDMGITILLVEHDMSLVMDICDHIVVLNYGRTIAEGAPLDVQRDPEVVRIYLGEDYAEATEY